MRTHLIPLAALLSLACGKDDAPIKVGSCMTVDTGETEGDTGEADADADADIGDPTETGDPGDTGTPGDTGEDSDTGEPDGDDTGTSGSIPGSDTGMMEGADTGSATVDTGGVDEAVVDPPRFIETPDFLLADVNESSELFGLGDISPFDYTGKTTAWYFTKASCGYCRGQYSLLNFMQAELEAERPDLDIQFFAINDESAESYADIMAALGDLPILQDTETEDAWGDWSAVWRDVYIIDDTNHFVEVINLTGHSLGETENYDAMKDLVVSTAEGLR